LEIFFLQTLQVIPTNSLHLSPWAKVTRRRGSGGPVSKHFGAARFFGAAHHHLEQRCPENGANRLSLAPSAYFLNTLHLNLFAFSSLR
jgi:hypothetical protein